MILHNLKVAVRNLMKYKLQTAISVLSIAVGIVTLSFAHSILSRYQLPPVFNESYVERTYQVYFKPVSEQVKEKINNEMRMFTTMHDGTYAKIDVDIIRAIKGNGGLSNAERVAVPNYLIPSLSAEFHLSDSTVRTGDISGKLIDPDFPNFAGLRSAITGKKIKRLKKGEAIMSEDAARTIFGDKNPIGAVQTISDEWLQLVPATIIDVYEATPILESQFNNKEFYFCISDSIEENFPFQSTFTSWIYIVLKEGSKKADLQKEVNARIGQLGYEPVLTLISEYPQYKKVVPLRILIHILGSLILLTAIIGFLRIEIQLFHIRRRELALRITNGATRLQVFGCLFAEITIVIVLAVTTALILGVLLQEFIDTKLKIFSDYSEFKVGGLWLISLVTGLVLLSLCSGIAWIILNRIIKERNGIVSNIRRSSNNIFRNSMLCIQVIICIVFVSGSLIIFKGGKQILIANNVPEEDAVYSNYLYLTPYHSSDANRLLDEISVLPDIEKMVLCGGSWTALSDFMDNTEIMEKLNGDVYSKFYVTNDTSLLSVLGLDVKWMRKDIDRNSCFILSEKIYKKFKELGVPVNSTLTQKYSGLTFPIGGTVQNMPYDNDGGEFIIAIYPEANRSDNEIIIIPKAGRYKPLLREIKNTIRRVEPQTINELIFNFRDRQNMFPSMVEAISSAGWILGIVSLIICAMSIYSTIALDSRARRKEVAIRRVNGAKSGDIYRMFGRVYMLMIAISIVIAVPLCIMFNHAVEGMLRDIAHESVNLSPVGPILLGSFIVIFLIFVIIGWQICGVMKVDTAKIIPKE